MEQGLSRDPFCHLARHFGIFGDASAGQTAKLERDADENDVVPLKPLHLRGSGETAFRRPLCGRFPWKSTDVRGIR